ncbi:glycine betaine ABC transporter substrate-binding protein [Draconibacterium halophilum]|uniref:Glycine betaine ABC transporter substrate-binding protein n=1 Tax=Draconibacterium halophilum TaxID=2706887 RepID=A0A6C0R7W7_9BACT|nr:glycine betaine ABC transporter substrate-binding protein [Draconibacterium halophilum]QIA06408.1 glycine betaine ABC transporter substrate-binding protein [Draconibacterium halophilum]
MIQYFSKTKVTVLIILLAFFSSCNTGTETEDERSLKIVYTDWSESVAITYLSYVLLEEHMDYKVILKLTDVETAYREVANNEADIFTDAWLPETHKQYFDEHQDKLEMLGITYPEARTGLVVPAYSELKSVADLENYPHPIVGIDPGAGVMQKAQAAIDKYSPGNTLLALSEEEMVEQLGDSIKRRLDIVVTGWEPHWIFARYDVRFLDDPDNIFGQKENIYTIARTGLEEEHPNAVRFFERMQLTEMQLNNLVYEIRVSKDPVEGVNKWMEQNEYVVNQWMKNLTKERLKIM